MQDCFQDYKFSVPALVLVFGSRISILLDLAKFALVHFRYLQMVPGGTDERCLGISGARRRKMGEPDGNAVSLESLWVSTANMYT